MLDNLTHVIMKLDRLIKKLAPIALAPINRRLSTDGFKSTKVARVYQLEQIKYSKIKGMHDYYEIVPVTPNEAKTLLELGNILVTNAFDDKSDDFLIETTISDYSVSIDNVERKKSKITVDDILDEMMDEHERRRKLSSHRKILGDDFISDSDDDDNFDFIEEERIRFERELEESKFYYSSGEYNYTDSPFEETDFSSGNVNEELGTRSPTDSFNDRQYERCYDSDSYDFNND